MAPPRGRGFMHVDLLPNDTASLLVPVIGAFVLLYVVWHSEHFEALTTIVANRGETLKRAENMRAAP